MLRSSIHAALAALTLILSGCLAAPRRFDETTHPPFPPTYDWRKAVTDWIKGVFVEHASLRSVMISNPVAIDAPSGANWLVCIEIDARAKTGEETGPKRFAFAFQTVRAKDGTGKAVTSAVAIAPDDYRRLPAIECDKHPLQWTPWSDGGRTPVRSSSKR